MLLFLPARLMSLLLELHDRLLPSVALGAIYRRNQERVRMATILSRLIADFRDRRFIYQVFLLLHGMPYLSVLIDASVQAGSGFTESC